MATAEHARLLEARAGVPWRAWGPYLSERQWGTVREDTSDTWDSWNAFPHDHARSRAYRWGEDGIAGISDDRCRLCFAVAMWNGVDPILKERLFGLTNTEGNHGEDVKEYYFYVDATPTHSYLRYLYKYPQVPFPYDELVEVNRHRSRTEHEYELVDTGVFDEGRYFDVTVEYAKADPADLCVRVTVDNRGPDPATIHLLPTLWFRNTWDWGDPVPRPQLVGTGPAEVLARHDELGEFVLWCEGQPELLFCENETNAYRLWGRPNVYEHHKDGINDFVVNGRAEAVKDEPAGTKMAARWVLPIPSGGRRSVRLRLAPRGAPPSTVAGADRAAAVDAVIEARRREADEFYDAVTPQGISDDRRAIFRQAMAGMIWSKQWYELDQDRWLKDRGADPLSDHPAPARNPSWFHLAAGDVISMPDTWEYPWFAAWDLAFHTLPFNLIDPDFARQQLRLLLNERYLHPNGQIPAYEWAFSDVNPPVHAWAAMFNHYAGFAATGESDHGFLADVFTKLLLNFTWWVNRKDPHGKNVFEGGFLGLDNIGVFDRSAPIPGGGTLEQADGTAWMAFYSHAMFQMALELARHDPVYEDFAVRFLEHYFLIAGAMDRAGEYADELWDEEDGFFYDVLRLPDGRAMRLKVRSTVGLMPLCAAAIIEPDEWDRIPALGEHLERILRRNPGLVRTVADPRVPGVGGRRLLSVLTPEKLRRVLARMLDERRFLSPYGLRSLSRHHLDEPYRFTIDGHEWFEVAYWPAESQSGMFGGNSNWRGPVWFPTNMLVLRALVQLYLYYGDEFTVECPTGSGVQLNLYEVAQELARRLVAIFERDEHGRRPVYGDTELFQRDPHFRDLVLFYEYFHGDNGAGIGASHQTGWTGLVASLIAILHGNTASEVLADGLAVLVRPPGATTPGR